MEKKHSREVYYQMKITAFIERSELSLSQCLDSISNFNIRVNHGLFVKILAINRAVFTRPRKAQDLRKTNEIVRAQSLKVFAQVIQQIDENMFQFF